MLGAALIGVGIVSGGTGFALNSTQGFGFFGGGLAAKAANVGVGLVLMGVSNMLFPQPNQKTLMMNKILEYHLVFLGCKILVGQELAILSFTEKLLLVQL